MSDLIFKREECSHAKGQYYYDVLAPWHGGFHTIGDLHQHGRGGAGGDPGPWMYGQEDDCASLSVQDLFAIASKLLELNLDVNY